MPQADIVFGPFQEGSFEELGGASPRALNVVIDPKGVVSKRPGIVGGVTTDDVIDAAGIIGLHSTYDGQLFAVGGTPMFRKLYKLFPTAALDISQVANGKLRGSRRPIFAETEPWMLIAGGDAIQKVDLATLVSSQLGGDPPLASHIVANSSRLLANDLTVDKTKVRFSGIAQGTVDTSGHEQWDNTGLTEDGGFFTAEARPDPVVAIRENTNEVFVWGVDNVQIFAPNGDPPFVPAATRESGCLAPYSIIKQGQEYLWLDQHRRIVYSDGRSFQNLEGPIKRQLDELRAPTDCFGYRVFTGHVDCLVWTFPTDGRTFAYQVGGGWSEWHGWDNSIANFTRLAVNAHHLRRDGGLNIVGTRDGRVGKFSLDAFDDLGSPIVAYVESGFNNRETDNLKKCRAVRIAIRRGENSAGSVAQPTTEVFRTYGRLDISIDQGMGIGNPGPNRMGIEEPTDPSASTFIHVSVDSIQGDDVIALFDGVTHIRMAWIQGGGGEVRYRLLDVELVQGDTDYFRLTVAGISSTITEPFDADLSGSSVTQVWLQTETPAVVTPAPRCRLEWRDDTGPWKGPLLIDIGTTGDNDCIREFRSLGTYRRRQWKFTFSDSVNLSLVKVTEDFQVLGS